MTAKSKTALGTENTTNFADNTTGDISAQDTRDFHTNLMDSIYGSYGSLLVSAGASAQSLTTSAAKLTCWAANGNSANTTPDHTNDQITISLAGEYFFFVNLCCTGTSTHIYTFAPRLDGSAISNVQTQFTNATGHWSVFLTGTMTVTAGQVFTVYGASNQGGGSNLTVVNGQAVVKVIG